MTISPLLTRQRDLLHQLLAELRHRATDEPLLDRTTQQEREAVLQQRATAEKQATTQLEKTRAQLEAELQLARDSLTERFKAEQQAAAKERSTHRAQIRFNYKNARETLRSADQDQRWSIAAVMEGARTQAREQLHQEGARAAERLQALHQMHEQVVDQLKRWHQPLLDLETEPLQQPRLRKFKELFSEAEELRDALDDLRSPAWAQKPRLLGVFTLVALVLVYPLGLLLVRLLGWPAEWPTLLGTGAIGAFLLAGMLGMITASILTSVSRKAVRALYTPLRQVLSEAKLWHDTVLAAAEETSQEQIAEAKKVHNQKVLEVEAKHQENKKALQAEKTRALEHNEKRFRRRLLAAKKLRDDDLSAAEARFQQGMAQCQQQFEAARHHYESRCQQRLQEIETAHRQQKADNAARWERILTQLRSECASQHATCAALFPEWSDPRWQSWQPGGSLPEFIRYGSYQVDLDQLWTEAGGMEGPALGAHTFPLVSSFPEQSSLLFLVEDEGRAVALASVRAVMMRLLTSVPAGKLRFTILDPVGLGQNFAAFMNLADYDENLVASRIWTEQAHIEQRLIDLTAHMENVIQKYLRNRYQTITEYNQEAGELAEPYRVLVVANFPVNFSLEAARRLVSICQSGSRCGVSTLITVDRQQPLPQGFNLADLENAGATLIWNKGQMVWKDADFERYPLQLETAPDDAFCNRLLERVGETTRAAGNVQVPFDFIMPEPSRRWTGDSRDGLRVPLGRSGATKRQYLDLGQGTSQHVLVAGKTGSGKSTLLHALITNLALHYSPQEVELYLIDFKKGVEFKTYATHELPHARVIAIESEREFGLSVLQRLDAELKTRGERFRSSGAQNLKGYRDATGAGCPRILLIVDEFQEFFVEDDRIAQDSAQLLDRLVRQGRAFGLHVLLGSQTLGGAYSLARSTIDQMAVRIALQCSEADAALILSDENSAARLLARPGEAIYNDANGRVEGNNPFQVVWLSDERREELLREVRQKAEGALRPTSPLVFEGHAPGDLRKNVQFLERLENLGQLPEARVVLARRPTQVWLGDAIAIKDPTAAVFARQSGSNLLIVGGQEQATVGLMTAALLGLATQCEPSGAGNLTPAARFYLLDGSPAEGPTAGVLGRVARVVPHPLRSGGWRELTPLLTELSRELEERQRNPDQEAPAIHLLLYNAQRFRDLRRSEDDFGFGRRGDEPATPAQMFSTLLREGPPLGIHVTLSCDTLTNLQRLLDRQGMRECSLRVVFQMNVSDSTTLIDSPLASKLGVHRALFANEEEGRLEKFRPYEVPPENWLDWVRDCFAALPPSPPAPVTANS